MNRKSTGNVTQSIFLGVFCLMVVFRLFVWKFFINLDSFIKEDLSNLLCVMPILVCACIFYGRKAIYGLPLQARRTGLEPVLWALFSACAFSLFISIDRTATVRYVIVWFSYLLYFFMLTEVLDTDNRRRWFLIFILAIALLIAGWGIRDYVYLIGRAPDPADEFLANTNDSLYYILTHKRACSLFGWPNVLAGFLGLTIPLGFSVALAWRSVWAKWLAGVSVLVMVGTLLLTFSFLGWLSFLIGFVGAIIALLCRREWMGRGVKITLICFAIVTVGLFTVVIVKKNFAVAVSPRQQYLHQAVQGIVRHPIVGTGLDTFRYASAREATDKGGLTAFAHNAYLQLWVEAGIPGFLAGLALVFFVLRKFYGLVWRRESVEERLRAAVFAWAFTTCFVDNIWSFTIIKPNIGLFFWVVLAYACSFDTREVVRRENRGLLRSIAGWMVVAASGLVLLLAVRGAAAQWLCKNAFEAEMKGHAEQAMRYFNLSRKIDPGDTRIPFELGKRYVQLFQSSGQARFLDLAEQEFLASVDNAPFYGSRLLLGLICKSQGRVGESRDWIAEAYSVSPQETERDLKAIGILR